MCRGPGRREWHFLSAHSASSHSGIRGEYPDAQPARAISEWVFHVPQTIKWAFLRGIATIRLHQNHETGLNQMLGTAGGSQQRAQLFCFHAGQQPIGA